MRFTLTRAIGAALVATTIATSMAVSPTSQAAGGVSAAQLGMYVGYDRGDRFADMEQRLNQPIKWVVTMAGKRSPTDMTNSVWGQLAASGAYLPAVANRVNLVLSVPLGFGAGGLYRQVGGPEKVRRTLTDVASGVHDGAYRAVARRLISAGYGDAVLRLGHEFDGTYEPYSARDNNAAYIAAYRRVRDLFERESSAFRYEWTSMRAHFRQYGPPAYPGDAYVDIVGLDIYYREPGPISDRVWTNQYLPVLDAHREFAAARGKPVAYSEWGRGMADESRFIGLMHGWFSSLGDQGPGSLVYQSYFNESRAEYDLARLPAVRQSYLQLFGRSGSAPPPPPAGPSGAVTSPGTATTPTVTVTPSAQSFKLEWSHPQTPEGVNVRYRPVGTTTWTWLSNGSRSQQLSGLAPATSYELQVRLRLSGSWQGWTSVTATTATA